MTYSYDLATDIGKTRLLIPDRVEASAIFTDEELQAFLDLNDGNTRRAAAEALEMIASDEAMTLKVITTLDLSTNGASTSAAILERARLLRSQAAAAEDGEDGGAFDYAEMADNAFARRERVVKQAMRQ